MDRIALETLRQELLSDGKVAARVAAEFPALIEAFIEQVERQQGLDKAP